MRVLQSKYSYLILFFLIVNISLVVIILNNRNIDSIAINYNTPGNIQNIGCLSIYIDDKDNNNEYSFDGGKTWQKSKYGAVYSENTIIKVRNQDKKVIFVTNVNSSFAKEAPVIKLDFDNIIKNKTDSELLRGVTATLNEENVTSNVNAYILEENGNKILVSYIAEENDNICYLLKEIEIDENIVIPTPSPTPTPKNSKWVWPTNTPYSISRGYGSYSGGFHSGVDIYGLRRGSPIYAAYDGVVFDINSNSSSGYYVIIKHDNGYYTRYAHMQNTKGNDKLGLTGSATKYVKKGQRVKASDIIGELGSSGHSTGLHLHFEIWDGEPFKAKSYNPLNFYKK